MELALPFGSGRITFELALPPGNLAIARRPPRPEPAGWDELAERALQSPMGAPPIEKAKLAGKSAAVLVDPAILPVAEKVLPHVIHQLEQASAARIVIVGCSPLPAHSPTLPLSHSPALADFVQHDPVASDHAFRGFSALGTPIFINKTAAEADVRIAVGTVQPHPWLGYSGGYDAIIPGLAALTTIVRHQALWFSPNSSCGRLGDNPARLDAEYAGAITGLDFILDFVVTLDGSPVSAFAGDPIKAHRAAVNSGDKLVWGADLGGLADAAIASPGEAAPPEAYVGADGVRPGAHAVCPYMVPEGKPDAQPQQPAPFDPRTLDFVAAGVKPRGTIVLLAGPGHLPVPHDPFERELLAKPVPELAGLFEKRTWHGEPEAAFARLQAILRTWAIHRTFFSHDVRLVGSELSDDELDRLNAVQDGTIEEAIEPMLAALGKNARVALVPDASGTLCLAELH
ncbi:MAG TPA: lactate racemase domain-containing protein [Planctomycetota bacterium]|nr:lactate racemase domain-containing protein [Planctomycetota bacterium]